MRAARVYDERKPDDGLRVLVDRLWPRGVRRDDDRVDRWLKDVAPSTELRRWYGHEPERFDEFTRRYEAELAGGSAAAALAELVGAVRRGPVTLTTATKDIAYSHVAVLGRLIDESGVP